jgi:hypothetical protein
MTTNLDLYFSLQENERNIVIIAAKAGDTPMTRQLLQLYFPELAPQDVTALIKDLRGVAS